MMSSKRKPRPGRPGLNGLKAGCRGCGEYLRSEFTLTVASLLVPPHSVAARGLNLADGCGARALVLPVLAPGAFRPTPAMSTPSGGPKWLV
jgi:hypothetical protein